MLASEVDRLKKDELDLRLKLEAAEKRVEIAEIQAEQDNSKAAENVKQIVLSMHHQLAEKQAAQVENQSPASVVLMQGTETKDPDPLETTSSKQSSSSIVMMKETKVNENSESTLNDIREKVDSLFQAFLTAQNNSQSDKTEAVPKSQELLSKVTRPSLVKRYGNKERLKDMAKLQADGVGMRNKNFEKTYNQRWDLFDSRNVSRQKSYVSRTWFRENTDKFLDPRKGEVVSKMNDVMLEKREAFVYNYSHSIYV